MQFKLQLPPANAIQYNGNNEKAIVEYFRKETRDELTTQIAWNHLKVQTPSATVLKVAPTDWVVRSYFGQFFVVNNRQFREDYVPVATNENKPFNQLSRN